MGLDFLYLHYFYLMTEKDMLRSPIIVPRDVNCIWMSSNLKTRPLHCAGMLALFMRRGSSLVSTEVSTNAGRRQRARSSLSQLHPPCLCPPPKASCIQSRRERGTSHFLIGTGRCWLSFFTLITMASRVAAYATLLTREEYLPGVLVLNYSMKACRSKYSLIVMITPTIAEDDRVLNAPVKTIDFIQHTMSFCTETVGWDDSILANCCDKVR
jgi:hypothetical protein